MPPPPPKASAPAPPKKSAPKPPGSKSTFKSKSKPKPKPKVTTNNTYQAKDDSTYELGKTAASAAGAAAKAAFLSFGSKVKKDVKSFTKKELENVGVDTNKPKKPNKPKEKQQPAPAPSQLKSYNMNWNNSKSKSKSIAKPKPKSKSKSNEFGAPKKPPKFNHNRSKSKGSKPPPPKKKNITSKTNGKTNGKKNGVSSRLAMFEEKDRKAGKSGGLNKNKTKSKAKPPPKKKSKENKSNGFFNKNKNKNNDKDGKQEKNLKPSMIKNKKKSPPLKPKSSPDDNKQKTAAPPPSELKSVNVDWKAQRAKMANVFKKKDDDKESKVKTKTKEIVGGFKKVKASVTAESVDASKPPPKKMNLFKKNKSTDSDDDEQENKSTKKLTFSAPWKKSKSADINDDKKTSSGPLVPPPPPPDSQPNGMAKSKSYSPFKKGSSGLPPPDFDLATVNKKVAKPEDYNEIQFKAVDPMELRRQQKLKGAGRFGPRTATIKANKPTSASSLASKQKSAATASMMKPPPVPNINKTKKKAPSLPAAPPPKPKPKKVLNREGVLEVMPSNKEQGWVFSAGGMFSVPAGGYKKLKTNGVFEGAPVSFESMDKKAANIKLLTKVDANIAIECLTKKKNGKTKHDGKYFIYDTEFQFDGNLSTNAFEIPQDCSAKSITKLSEKIINAFMNTNGGILYIGIDKSWNIKGVDTEKIDLPQIRQQIINMVGKFEPRLDNADLKKLKFTTKAIITKEGNLKEDILVLKITIPGPFKDDKNDNIVFATENGDKFKKNLNYIMKVVM